MSVLSFHSSQALCLVSAFAFGSVACASGNSVDLESNGASWDDFLNAQDVDESSNDEASEFASAEFAADASDESSVALEFPEVSLGDIVFAGKKVKGWICNNDCRLDVRLEPLATDPDEETESEEGEAAEEVEVVRLPRNAREGRAQGELSVRVKKGILSTSCEMTIDTANGERRNLQFLNVEGRPQLISGGGLEVADIENFSCGINPNQRDRAAILSLFVERFNRAYGPAK